MKLKISRFVLFTIKRLFPLILSLVFSTNHEHTVALLVLVSYIPLLVYIGQLYDLPLLVLHDELLDVSLPNRNLCIPYLTMTFSYHGC